jgi:hypothetical protein
MRIKLTKENILCRHQEASDLYFHISQNRLPISFMQLNKLQLLQVNTQIPIILLNGRQCSKSSLLQWPIVII